MLEKDCMSCIHYIACSEVDELADTPCDYYIDKVALQFTIDQIVDVHDEIQEELHLLHRYLDYIQRELNK